MTEDEALEKYAALLAGGSDIESLHCAEDRLMMDAIRAAGWARLADTLTEVRHTATRWFA